MLCMALSAAPQQHEALSLLCEGTTPDAITIDIVYQGQGETHLSWEFPSTEALWAYDFPTSPHLQRYDEWLQTRQPEAHESVTLSALEHRINATVGQSRLGVIRPLNCLEATLLARQVQLNSPAHMREFVAYVLRSDATERTKIYWLAGPGEFPPKADRLKPLIRKDVQAGWRLYAIIHNHTGPAPVAAPSGSDTYFALSWAEEGAERFIVLGGLRAFDASSAELRVFMSTTLAHAQDRDRGEEDRAAAPITRQEYAEAVAKIDRAVAAGEMTAEEEALEVLYQRILREHPGVEGIPKERLMPRLRVMLEEELAREGVGNREGASARGAGRGPGDDRGRNRAQIQNSDNARARAEKAMRDALKVMRDADKLTDEQVEEILNIVFPKDIDWDARYEAFLKANSGVEKAVKSGKISKDKVIAGIKSREGERPPTEEEQLEGLYQRMLKNDPTLGRTPKAELMPQLKAMLERGEGQDLRRDDTKEPRFMTFGRYLSDLIYGTRQVAMDDADLKKVHDLGVAEIKRQDRQKERGQAAERARGG